MSYIYNKIVVKVKRKVRLNKIDLTSTFPTYLFYLVLQITLNKITETLNGKVISYGII